MKPEDWIGKKIIGVEFVSNHPFSERRRMRLTLDDGSAWDLTADYSDFESETQPEDSYPISLNVTQTSSANADTAPPVTA